MVTRYARLVRSSRSSPSHEGRIRRHSPNPLVLSEYGNGNWPDQHIWLFVKSGFHHWLRTWKVIKSSLGRNKRIAVIQHVRSLLLSAYSELSFLHALAEPCHLQESRRPIIELARHVAMIPGYSVPLCRAILDLI